MREPWIVEVHVAIDSAWKQPGTLHIDVADCCVRWTIDAFDATFAHRDGRFPGAIDRGEFRVGEPKGWVMHDHVLVLVAVSLFPVRCKYQK